MNPIERDYKNLVALDNETLSEIAKWHHENRTKLKTDKAFQFDFIRLCRERLIKVKVAYEQFLASHPNHTRARAAYASFLQNVRDEQGAIDQWHRAVQTDSDNAALWNNLANHLGTIAIETANTKVIVNALEYFKHAVELAPRESLYHNNYATALSLYKTQAAPLLHLSPEETSQLAFNHFKKAHELSPSNFDYAADLAEAHLDLSPLKPKQARTAWQVAARLAKTPLQKQWIELQLAMIELEEGNTASARERLTAIDNPAFKKVKSRLLTALDNPKRIPLPPRPK